eukprot:5862946-Amphidinium_carterae.1
MPDDEIPPAYHTIDEIDPWTPDEKDRRNKHIEAVKYYSRSLQYTVHIDDSYQRKTSPGLCSTTVDLGLGEPYM